MTRVLEGSTSNLERLAMWEEDILLGVLIGNKCVRDGQPPKECLEHEQNSTKKNAWCVQHMKELSACFSLMRT
jgi:hypothetical protein